VIAASIARQANLVLKIYYRIERSLKREVLKIARAFMKIYYRIERS